MGQKVLGDTPPPDQLASLLAHTVVVFITTHYRCNYIIK